MVVLGRGRVVVVLGRRGVAIVLAVVVPSSSSNRVRIVVASSLTQ